jgi:hypothetical protein
MKYVVSVINLVPSLQRLLSPLSFLFYFSLFRLSCGCRLAEDGCPSFVMM